MVDEKKMKLMLYSTLVEIEVDVGVELGNIVLTMASLSCYPDKNNQLM